MPTDVAGYIQENVHDIVALLNKRTTQSSLASVVSSRLYDVTKKDVVTTYEPRLVPYFLARFLSRSCREAAIWSAVIPSEPLFCISHSQYSYLLAYQLGCTLPGSRHWPSLCNCRTSLVVDPLHVFDCERLSQMIG